jgi:hypothetical protein
MNIAVRKMKFFLHPDKIPQSMNSQQASLCQLLWELTSEAWESYNGKA